MLGTVVGSEVFGFISFEIDSTLVPIKTEGHLRRHTSAIVPKPGLERVGLARTGGKQAILKRADHRLNKRIEFVSHNGFTSFPQLRALEVYHARVGRYESVSKNIAEKFRQPRMPRPARVASHTGVSAWRRTSIPEVMATGELGEVVVPTLSSVDEVIGEGDRRAASRLRISSARRTR